MWGQCLAGSIRSFTSGVVRGCVGYNEDESTGVTFTTPDFDLALTAGMHSTPRGPSTHHKVSTQVLDPEETGSMLDTLIVVRVDKSSKRRYRLILKSFDQAARLWKVERRLARCRDCT